MPICVVLFYLLDYYLASFIISFAKLWSHKSCKYDTISGLYCTEVARIYNYIILYSLWTPCAFYLTINALMLCVRWAVSNEWQMYCLLNSFSRLPTKKTSTVCITSPLWGSSTGHRWISLIPTSLKLYIQHYILPNLLWSIHTSTMEIRVLIDWHIGLLHFLCQVLPKSVLGYHCWHTIEQTFVQNTT